MLVSEEGVVIRVKSADISKLGRSTQGVKVMNVSDADRVCAIARVSSGKKRKKPAGVMEGQQSLLDSDNAEVSDAKVATSDEDLDEDLADEEFDTEE